MIEIPLCVACQVCRRDVAACSILLQRPHDDPIQVAAQLAAQDCRIRTAFLSEIGGAIAQAGYSRAGSDRFRFANASAQLNQCGRTRFRHFERQHSNQQLIEEYAERIHIAARIDIDDPEAHLFRAGIGRSTQQRAHFGQCELGVLRRGQFRQAEVDDFRQRAPILLGHQHIGGLDVTVYGAFLMRMLHGLTDLEEQQQSLSDIEFCVIAILRDPDAVHVFHDEVRTAAAGDSGIEHLGDARMLHQGEHLTLCLEARHDLARVHAGLEEFQGHRAANRRHLLGFPDFAHAAFTQLADEAEGADLLSRF